jgi:hypothetical protein
LRRLAATNVCQVSSGKKVRDDEASSPAREARALPGTALLLSLPIYQRSIARQASPKKTIL